MATTCSEDQTTEKHVDHLSHLSRPSPQTVTSNALPQYGHPQSTLLQHGPAQYAPSPYPQYGYSTGLATPESPAWVSDSTGSTVPPPAGAWVTANNFPAAIDTTGQIAPSGMKPRVTASLWEDEGSLCFQIEARGICVARREDNHMINGTKLLNVAGMTKGRRDGILESEKVRHVVKIGPLHLKGVWIPFDRALDFANKEKITEILYPLFVHDIGALLYHPCNQTRTNPVMATAQQRRAETSGQMRNRGPPTTAIVQEPMLEPVHHKAGPMPATPEVSDDDESSSPKQSSSDELSWKSAKVKEAGIFDSGRRESTKMKSSTVMENPRNEEYCSSLDEKKHVFHQFSSTSQSGTTEMSKNDNMPEALPQIIVVGDLSSGKSSVLESLSKVAPQKDQSIYARYATQIISRRTTGVEVVEREDVDAQLGSLSPSQKSPQSDSEHSSDSEAGLLTRNECLGILLERLMDYYHQLLSSCPSPVPITTTESPMMPNAGSGRQTTEDDRAPPPLPPPRFLDQSMDIKAHLSLHHSQNGLQNHQPEASFFNHDEYHQCNDQYNGPVQDGLDSAASQSNISASTAASENRKNNASYQSTSFIHKRGREKEDDDKDERRSCKHARLDNDKSTAPKRLACPYFKNDPEHSGLGRSCSGPGWATTHRLKEHLDRNHALPPSCVRCYTAFDTEVARDTHMRLQDQCQVKERPGRMHGFDAVQREQLRSRPKGYKHMSETQKWCHIYITLFPETASTDVPSPYYEFVNFRDSGHPVDPMIEYENFLRHEMPDRVRHQLELRIEEALNPLEETLRGQIVDIVRDVQLELFQSFRASTGPTRPNGDSVQESAPIEIDDNPDKSQDEEREGTDAQDSTLVARNTEPPGQFDSGQCSWEEQLEAYRQVPPLDFSFTDFDDFDGALFDFSSIIPAAQDSAYGTLSISQEETDEDEFIGNGTGI